MLCEQEGYALLVSPYKTNPYKVTLCQLNEHEVISFVSFNH